MNFSNLIKSISNAFVVTGYARTASELMSFSDKQLSDLGISRKLLEQGASAYPWREAAVIPDNVTSLEVAVELDSDSLNTQKAA